MLPSQHVVVETQTCEARAPIEIGNNACRTFSEELRLAEGVAGQIEHFDKAILGIEGFYHLCYAFVC